jgi:hypothetical protein
MSKRTKAEVSMDRDSLYQIAEIMRNSITGGKGISLEEYKRLAVSTPMRKIGYSFAWMLKNEVGMRDFFPLEIISIISSRISNRYRFDEYADSVIVANRNRTAKEIGMLLCVDRDTIAHRAQERGIQLKLECHKFSQQEDEIIKKFITMGTVFIGKLIKGATRQAIWQRAKFLGLLVQRKRFVKYSEEELKILEQADLAEESDEGIARKLGNRTARSVFQKRSQIRKLRKKLFIWRHHPKKWRYVLANYKTMTYEQIAEKLGLTYSQVMHKAWRKGLRKRP